MAGMMLTVRAHSAANTGDGYGPGGPRCVCCGPAPQWRKRERRTVRRREAMAWRREAREVLAR